MVFKYLTSETAGDLILDCCKVKEEVIVEKKVEVIAEKAVKLDEVPEKVEEKAEEVAAPKPVSKSEEKRLAIQKKSNKKKK